MNYYKIIFLDIDGVLNTSNRELDDICLQNLKFIIDSTSAKIVLSSTWRKFEHLLNELEFSFQKFKIPRWIDQTPIINDIGFNLDRTFEILSWLKGKINIQNWVAIDDENLSHLNPHNFITRQRIGLTFEISEKIITFLNKPYIEIQKEISKRNSNYHKNGTPNLFHNGE